MSKFIKYYKRLDADKILQDKKDRIKECLWNYDTVNKILPVIKEYCGKKITKHIANAIQKKTGIEAIFRYQYGMYHINIKKPSDLRYNESDFSLLIGYDTNPTLEDGARIDYYAQCYTLEKERAEAMQKGLEKIKLLCTRFNKALDEINQCNQEAEEFGFEYDLDIDSKYLK